MTQFDIRHSDFVILSCLGTSALVIPKCTPDLGQGSIDGHLFGAFFPDEAEDLNTT
jgi:hypothetical protein